jgi:hypothetical protein
MDVRLHSLPARASALRKPAIALGLITLTALLAISVFAESWENKDWTQWTTGDCNYILTSSPWAGIGPRLNVTSPTSTSSYSNVIVRSILPIAVIASSHVVRQALERRAQFDEHYEKMSLEQRQAFDQRAAICLSKNLDDRIIVRIPPEASGEYALFVDGHEVPSLPLTQPNAMSPCPADQGADISFLDVEQGNPLIHPGNKKIQIKSKKNYTFTFYPEKMIYKGKLDY